VAAEVVPNRDPAGFAVSAEVDLKRDGPEVLVGAADSAAPGVVILKPPPVILGAGAAPPPAGPGVKRNPVAAAGEEDEGGAVAATGFAPKRPPVGGVVLAAAGAVCEVDVVGVPPNMLEDGAAAGAWPAGFTPNKAPLPAGLAKRDEPPAPVVAGGVAVTGGLKAFTPPEVPKTGGVDAAG
jgi:hypothetical protein